MIISEAKLNSVLHGQFGFSQSLYLTTFAESNITLKQQLLLEMNENLQLLLNFSR